MMPTLPDFNVVNVMSGSQCWFRSSPCWIEGKKGSICTPTPASLPFSSLHGKQCNFRGLRLQPAQSCTPSCSPKYSGSGKVPPRSKQYSQTTCNESSFVYVHPASSCGPRFHEICFMSLMVCVFVPTFQLSSLSGESSSTQRRLQTKAKNPHVMNLIECINMTKFSHIRDFSLYVNKSTFGSGIVS